MAVEKPDYGQAGCDAWEIGREVGRFGFGCVAGPDYDADRIATGVRYADRLRVS